MSLPYYPMFPKDFDASEKVRVMTWSERGLYITLLNHSWLNDGLPVDPEHVRRVCGADRDEFAQMWPQVERCFPVADDGRRRNARQEEERAKAEKAHAIAVERAQKAAEKRWNPQGSSQASKAACSEHASTSGSASSSGVVSGKGECEGENQIEASVQPIVDELEEIYRKAGTPIPEKHKQLALQSLLSIPAERRARVPNYCKWALVSGKWPSAAKTKSLLNVLRDGDWDVDLAPRILPMPRQASARELAHERAAEKFRRMP